jgi:ferredoxin
MPSPAETHTPSTLTVDRIACTGHGVCASLLPEHVALDEWGYPSCPRRSSTRRWATSPSGCAPPARSPGRRAAELATY